MALSFARVRLFGLASFVILAATAGLVPVRADDFAGDVPDRVWIDVGGSYNSASTDVALRGPSGIGATINFEDVFDLPGTKTTARMLGFVRISEKRRYIDFGYCDISRRATRTLTEDVKWDDLTYRAGGEVRTRFGTQFMYAAFRYDFLHEPKIRISGSAGLTAIRFIASVNGESGFVDDANGTPVTSSFEREGSATAPVPMIGLNLDWALTNRLVLRTYSRFFKLNLSSFNGGLNENGIRLNWYFVRHFGLGIGYDRSSLDMKELKVGNGNVLKANYTVTGVGLFANLAF
jgi:hypothetical protein